MEPIYHLRDLLPDPESLLVLEPEELAGLLLQAFKMSGHKQFSRHNIMLSFTHGTPPPYQAPYANQIPPVIAEAWAWLERECLLITKPTDAHWQVLSRRAMNITTPADFEVYRGASSFPLT